MSGTPHVKNYQEHGGERTVIGGQLDVASGGELDIESGGALKVASGGELDIESGGALKVAGSQVTPSAADLNVLANALAGATIVVGTEVSNVINVAIQLQDADGDNLAIMAAAPFYLSDNADGSSLAAAAPSGGIAIGTNGVMIETVAGKAGTLVSEANGDIDINITEVGGATWYLVLILPNGSLEISDAITFVA